METTKDIHGMIRVNQAGEYGAVRIYQGQCAVLGKNADLQKMLTQEKEHLKQFNRLMIEHKVRPTLMQPIWHVGGYVLGAVTALLGEKAAHACTIAVETVIDEHYQNQLRDLESSADHQDLRSVIHKCHEEEIDHKSIATEKGGEDAKGFALLNETIQAISKSAIWLSSRI